MPIEAELKARVRDVPSALAALDARATGIDAVYRDHYFDAPDGSFADAGHELRIRTVETDSGVRHLLTYKSPAVDADSGSKPEYETTVGDPDATASVMVGLGYRTKIAFTKRCRNYRFHHGDRAVLATMVTVPEIEGTFLEVETIVGTEAELAPALEAVRSVLADLGIREDDYTTELYTDAVAKAHASAEHRNGEAPIRLPD